MKSYPSFSHPDVADHDVRALVLEGMYQQGFVRRFRIATAVSPPQP
jgi:hypothetical protein